MSKTISEHEDINLHIKKKTLYCILRGIFAWSSFLYLYLGYWYSLSPKINELGFYSWWMFPSILNTIIILWVYAIIAVWITVWEIKY